MSQITTTIEITVADKPGRPPAEVRLRQWLKVGLRAFGIRARWAPVERGKETTLKTQTAATSRREDRHG